MSGGDSPDQINTPPPPPLSAVESVNSTICMVYFRLTQAKGSPTTSRGRKGYPGAVRAFKKQTFAGGFATLSHPMHGPLLVCGAEQFRTTPASNLNAATLAFAGCDMAPAAGGWTTLLRQAPLRTRCKCSGSGGLCVSASVPTTVLRSLIGT